ncbi:putative roadblock/LC7 domain-containing protein [Streptomyces sp. Tu6071]|nr:putative roadblock/LC7 domain-containing protein [Streptomyces sp. Tu6071]
MDADPLDEERHLVGDLADVRVGSGEDGEAASVARRRDEEEGVVEFDECLPDAARVEVASDALGEAVEAGGDGGEVFAVLAADVLGHPGGQAVAGEDDRLADAGDPGDEVVEQPVEFVGATGGSRS